MVRSALRHCFRILHSICNALLRGICVYLYFSLISLLSSICLLCVFLLICVYFLCRAADSLHGAGDRIPDELYAVWIDLCYRRRLLLGLHKRRRFLRHLCPCRSVRDVLWRISGSTICDVLLRILGSALLFLLSVLRSALLLIVYRPCIPAVLLCRLCILLRMISVPCGRRFVLLVLPLIALLTLIEGDAGSLVHLHDAIIPAETLL